MMRITMNPGFLTEQLQELGWEAAHIQVVYDRLYALAQAGEDHTDVAVRLNPAKPPKRPYVAPERGLGGLGIPARARRGSEPAPDGRDLTRA